MPRIQLPCNTLSGPRNQSIEMSKFLRAPRSSLCDGPTLSQPSCKPFQTRHGSQHCEGISVHTGSQLFVFVVRVACRPSALQEPQISVSQHMAASLVPYIAFFTEANLMHARFAQLCWQCNCHASPSFYIDEHDTLGSWWCCPHTVLVKVSVCPSQCKK